MTELCTKLGVVTGMIATPFFIEPVIKLLMGDCFFEQGCEFETLKLFAAFAGSCVSGFCIGWIVYRATRFFQKRRVGE